MDIKISLGDAVLLSAWADESEREGGGLHRVGPKFDGAMLVAKQVRTTLVEEVRKQGKHEKCTRKKRPPGLRIPCEDCGAAIGEYCLPDCIQEGTKKG